MRLLTFCAFFIAATIAEASSVLGPDGKPSASHVSAFVASVEPFIREYPPRFKDNQHQEQVLGATKQVVVELETADLSSVKDQKLLTDIAHTFAMAHNVNLGTAPKAKSTFESALALNPNDRRTNYLFGMFLISTRAYHFDALPYLEKAHSLGEKDALFSIGLLLVQKGEKQKGLEALEAYAREHPESSHAQRVIKGIKDGTLKFHERDG